MLMEPTGWMGRQDLKGRLVPQDPQGLRDPLALMGQMDWMGLRVPLVPLAQLDRKVPLVLMGTRLTFQRSRRTRRLPMPTSFSWTTGLTGPIGKSPSPR